MKKKYISYNIINKIIHYIYMFEIRVYEIRN
jgi:hypothetical protein